MDKNTLYRFFAGIASCAEKEQVRQWFESSSENQKEFFRERKLFDAINLHADSKIAARSRPVHRPRQKRAVKLSVMRFAAMLAVVFTLGLLARPYFADTVEKPAKVAYCEIVTPLGAKSELTLTDGTKVWLNAGSRLVYSNAFGQSGREVLLEGEAYFDVRENKHLPFDVKTSRLRIRATGTAFNVKAYPADATIETILVEGEVEISRIGKKTDGVDTGKVILKPEQRLILVKNTDEIVCETKLSANKTVAEPKDIGQQVEEKPFAKEMLASTDFMANTSWKDKRWRIDRESLSSLARKLERRYNVQIVFKDKDLVDFKFSGTIEDEPIEEVLRALALSAPVKFSLRGNRVYFSKNNQFARDHQSLYNQQSK
jgi:ferric-dicitrate binding protein FerR (iron transport regulator)